MFRVPPFHGMRAAKQAAEATATEISGGGPPTDTTTSSTTVDAVPTSADSSDSDTSDGSAPLAPANANRRRRVLLLGAGRVAAPALQLLLTRPDPTTTATEVTVVATSHEELQRLQRRFFPRSPHFETRVLDVSAMGEAELRQLVATKADVVLSLLPASLHPRVARACLAAGRHLVTSSYVSTEMAAMDAEARARGLVLLNEAGLDPGCV